MKTRVSVRVEEPRTTPTGSETKIHSWRRLYRRSSCRQLARSSDFRKDDASVGSFESCVGCAELGRITVWGSDA